MKRRSFLKLMACLPFARFLPKPSSPPTTGFGLVPLKHEGSGIITTGNHPPVIWPVICVDQRFFWGAEVEDIDPKQDATSRICQTAGFATWDYLTDTDQWFLLNDK